MFQTEVAAGLEGVQFVLPGVGALHGGHGGCDGAEVQPQPGQHPAQGPVAHRVLGLPPHHHDPPLLPPGGQATGCSHQTPGRQGYWRYILLKDQTFCLYFL